MWQVFVISRRRTSEFISTFFPFYGPNPIPITFNPISVPSYYFSSWETPQRPRGHGSNHEPQRPRFESSWGTLVAFLSLFLSPSFSPSFLSLSATCSITITVRESTKEQHMTYVHPQVIYWYICSTSTSVPLSLSLVPLAVMCVNSLCKWHEEGFPCDKTERTYLKYDLFLNLTKLWRFKTLRTVQKS